jgi:hypothetical protein
MLKIRKIAVLIFIFSAILAGCGEILTYPDRPVIEYKNFTLYSTTDDLGNHIFLGKMEISFTDGDGDVGLTQPDSTETSVRMNYNFFTSLYCMNNGKFEEVDSALGQQNYRIPYIVRTGQNKTLKGTIYIEFEYKLIEYDTIFYTFYLTDRNFHKSNTDTSDVIIFTGLNL